MSEYIIKVGKHDHYVKDYRFSALNGDIGLMLTERIEEAYKWDDLTEGSCESLAFFIGGDIIPIAGTEGSE
ncbi:hypothetical protein V5785_12525 [Bacillus subtilis]